MISIAVFFACLAAFASASCPPKGLPISLSIPLPATPARTMYEPVYERPCGYPYLAAPAPMSYKPPMPAPAPMHPAPPAPPAAPLAAPVPAQMWYPAPMPYKPCESYPVYPAYQYPAPAPAPYSAAHSGAVAHSGAAAYSGAAGYSGGSVATASAAAAATATSGTGYALEPARPAPSGFHPAGYYPGGRTELDAHEEKDNINVSHSEKDLHLSNS